MKSLGAYIVVVLGLVCSSCGDRSASNSGESLSLDLSRKEGLLNICLTNKGANSVVARLDREEFEGFFLISSDTGISVKAYPKDYLRDLQMGFWENEAFVLKPDEVICWKVSENDLVFDDGEGFDKMRLLEQEIVSVCGELYINNGGEFVRLLLHSQSVGLKR